MVTEKRVHFYSGGYKLSGFLFRPEKIEGKVPGIVVCHGYSGLIEVYMNDVARKLSSFGYVTLTFYHRGLGNSEGPRGRLIPIEQCDDIMNAITYMQTLKEVDPDRIGLYGTSFGGANVVYVGAQDVRAKCVVSVNGVGDGERWLRSLRRAWEWKEFVEEVQKDRINRVLKNKSKSVSILDIWVPDPQTYKILGKTIEATHKKWGVKYPLETADTTISFKPAEFVHKISPRALLLIHCENDLAVLPEESVDMYNRAGEPKKLVIYKGYIHHDVYKFHNPEGFNKTVREAGDWFKKYL